MHRYEIGQHGLFHTCFAERRQHAFDVSQEDAVRAEHEDALIFEWKAMRVQEVCGAVQCDHRLARAWPTLHDEHAVVRGTNDLVLLGLNGGDDVAELSRATTSKSGEQGAVATQTRVFLLHTIETLVVADAQVALAEEFVFDTEQLATLDGKVTSTSEPHRLATRRSIERLGYRRAPVDHHWFALLVGDGQTTDVETLDALALHAIDTTEHQRRVAEVEIGEARQKLLVESIALVTGLEGAPRVGLVQTADPPGVLPALFETGVSVVDVGLFGRQVGVLLAHFGGVPLYRRSVTPRLDE